jgi:predicted SAM-dependent methyltransferase
MPKLNLGCADDGQLEGYINLDLNKDLPNVLAANALYLPFKDNSMDEIYASHFLEHLTPIELDYELVECRRVLKPKGLFHIIVPDMEVLSKAWSAASLVKKTTLLIPAMFGSHRGPGQDHKVGLDSSILLALLSISGFNVGACYHNEKWDFWLEIKAYKTEKV